MVDRFIRHGATYCGDGTSSALATSNGGVGAWNNINILEGSAPAYGALASGQTIYIRSKNEAGNDITRTLGTDTAGNVTLGSSAGTASAWVTWVLDGGTIWPGISGTLTYTMASSYTVTQMTYNDIQADVPDRFALILPSMNSNIWRVSFGQYIKNKNWLIDVSANQSNYGDWCQPTTDWGEHTLENLHIKASHYYQPVFSLGNTTRTVLINPTIELLAPIGSQEGYGAVIGAGGYGGRLIIIGGSVSGVGATTGATLINGTYSGSSVVLVGFQVPRAMALGRNSQFAKNQLEATGLDGGNGGALIASWGYADSRQDGYYPTLNAFFPDSANTPWSWKIYPSDAGQSTPFSMPVSKLYTEAAATKTINAEVLIADSITTANKNTVWIDVVYLDATTGLPVFLSTRNPSGASLASSTAGWTLTYGGDSTKVSIPLVGLFSKKSLSITTPTAIKQNTPILITLFGTIKAASSLDYLFFDPDVGVL